MDGDERMSSRVVLVKHCSILPPLFGAKREPTVDLVVGAPPARGTESPVFRVRGNLSNSDTITVNMCVLETIFYQSITDGNAIRFCL